MLTKMCDILAVWHAISIDVSLFSSVYQAGRLTISDLHPCTILMTRSVRRQETVIPCVFCTKHSRHDAISCHPCYYFHLPLHSIPKALFDPDTSTFIQKCRPYSENLNSKTPGRQHTSPFSSWLIIAKMRSLFFSFTPPTPADRLHCTVGVHPTRCKEIEDSSQGPEAYWDALRALLKAHVADGKIVAIGECGLDYDRCTLPRLLFTIVTPTSMPKEYRAAYPAVFCWWMEVH